MYHVFITRCLAEADFIEHGALFIFDIHKQLNYSLRVALYFYAIVFYVYWTTISISKG